MMGSSTTVKAAKLVVLYGIGGLSDVGRHAVQVALQRTETVTVLTQHPKKMEESNWDCGCPEPHFSDQDRARMQVVFVENWTKDAAGLEKHFQGATAVVSCVGNRQPGFFDRSLKKGWVSSQANQAVIRGTKKHKIKRAVVITSIGVEEDWPPAEFHFGGTILGWMFKTNTRNAVKDLTAMERAYRAEKDVDFLLVRPVGISEDCPPAGEWWIQKEKGKDVLGMNMAKLDVARYMVEEALNPTRHQSAVVIGAEPPNSKKGDEDAAHYGCC
jgi:hypothetical protein